METTRTQDDRGDDARARDERDDLPPWTDTENAVNDAINQMRKAIDQRAEDGEDWHEGHQALEKYREMARRLQTASNHFHATMMSDERPERASTSGRRPGATHPPVAQTRTVQTTQGPVETTNPQPAKPAEAPKTAEAPKR